MNARRLFRLIFLFASLAMGAAAADRSAYSGELLATDIARDLAQHFHSEGDLAVDLLRPWSPPTGTAAHWEFTITQYPTAVAANMLVRIRLKADGAVLDQSSVMVHATLMRDVWYAKGPIAAGTMFSPDLLDARRADVMTQRDAVPATAGDDSFVIARELPADRVLNWHDLAKRPLVHRGEVVEVQAVEGQLSLKMKALAMESGVRGALINVRNLETRRDIPAIVIGEDLVEVHF